MFQFLREEVEIQNTCTIYSVWLSRICQEKFQMVNCEKTCGHSFLSLKHFRLVLILKTLVFTMHMYTCTYSADWSQCELTELAIITSPTTDQITCKTRMQFTVQMQQIARNTKTYYNIHYQKKENQSPLLFCWQDFANARFPGYVNL